MLKTVVLRRFKKFKDTTVCMQPFTILMGENSSGKTTIIQAINLALNTFSQNDLIYERAGAINVRNKGVGFTVLPGINISDFRELYYAKISRGNKTRSIGDGSIGAYIELVDSNDNTYKLQISSLFGGFNVKCISRIEDLNNSPTLHKHSPLYISGFIGLRSSEERSFPVAIKDRLLSGQASTIIRNLVLDTYESSRPKYNMLKEKLEKNFGFYLENVLFDADKDIYVTAHYNDNCDSKKLSLDFNSSGSGFMQILQILTPIYRFCPETCKVVLLDEPDAHLHPNLQSTLAKTLRDIQQELNIQIIISTHSTSIIRAANPNEVIPVSALNKYNNPLSTEEDVEQQIIGKIDTYELGKTVISGKLVFFEDSNLDIFESFDRVLGTNCFTGANTVPVICGKGKDDKVPFQLGNVLLKYLNKEVEIHFVRDGDGLNDTWRENLHSFSDTNKVHLHQLQRHEIENYILVPALIHRTLSKKYLPINSIPSIEDIETKIVSLLKETVVLSKFSFDDNLEDSIYKTAMLLSIQEYRNPVISKSESKKVREMYENYITYNELINVGMGKETLKCLLKWLNDMGLNISKAEILRNVEPSDIPDEILHILNNIKSKQTLINPSSLESLDEEIIDDIEEDEVAISKD